MTKEMIISSNDHETRVAILEDDLVAELFVERERQRGVVGNIYKGRVSKVLPGMQSSFVDIGLERDGFLYVIGRRLATLDDVDDADEAGEAEGERRGRGADARRRAKGDRAAGASPEAARSSARSRRSSTCSSEGQDIARPGGQGAARHQGRAPDVATPRSPAASSSSCRRSTTSASRGRSSRARSAAACAASCASSARQEGFTGGIIIRTAASGRPKEDILSDLRVLQPDLEGDPAEDGHAARAGRSSTASRASSPSCCATC